MRGKRIGAVALATGLVAWNGLVDPRLPTRWQPLIRALVGSGLLVVARTRTGLRPPALWTGLRMGAVAAGALAAGVATTTAVPAVRAAIAVRELPPAAGWLLMRIPFGTVWSEEAAFRAALGTVGSDAFGPTGGQLVQATAFGLSHIADARATGEPIIGTVLVTGVAGWGLGWLARRSGSLAAPMLAHLAINEAGAIAALAYQRGPAALQRLRRQP